MGWLSGALGVGGSLAGSALQLWGNSKGAKDSRNWQERMSGSAHQREVADLRAAGLNPILSATGGSGASTPNGAAAQMQAPDLANSASRANEVSRENDVRSAQKKLLEEQTAATQVQRWLTASQNHKTDVETKAIIANNFPAMLKQEEIHNSPALQKMIKKEAWSDSVGRYSNSASGLFNTGLNIYKAIKR